MGWLGLQVFCQPYLPVQTKPIVTPPGEESNSELHSTMRNKETTQKIVKNNDRYHWRNFFRSECFVFTFEFNLNFWFAGHIRNLKRPMFHIFLHSWIIKVSSNQTFSIKYSVVWVHGYLVFSGITNQTFSIGKCDIWWSCPISLEEEKLKS